MDAPWCRESLTAVVVQSLNESKHSTVSVAVGLHNSAKELVKHPVLCKVVRGNEHDQATQCHVADLYQYSVSPKTIHRLPRQPQASKSVS
jgi:hypothetical protein